MKNISVLFVSLILPAIIAGCSATTTEYAAKGAATGAISASFVGAMTDLIVDGRVNTYRLSRNLVGGAIAGGVAGGMAGAQKEEATEKKAAAQQASYAAAPDKDVTDAEIEALIKEIGPDNVDALKALVLCRHEEAFHIALKTSRSEDPDYREAGLIIQALTDRDRDNTAGIERVLPEVVALNGNIEDVEAAKQGLEDIYNVLIDERKIQGLNPVCL